MGHIPRGWAGTPMWCCPGPCLRFTFLVLSGPKSVLSEPALGPAPPVPLAPAQPEGLLSDLGGLLNLPSDCCFQSSLKSKVRRFPVTDPGCAPTTQAP